MPARVTMPMNGRALTRVPRWRSKRRHRAPAAHDIRTRCRTHARRSGRLVTRGMSSGRPSSADGDLARRFGSSSLFRSWPRSPQTYRTSRVTCVVRVTSAAGFFFFFLHVPTTWRRPPRDERTSRLRRPLSFQWRSCCRPHAPVHDDGVVVGVHVLRPKRPTVSCSRQSNLTTRNGFLGERVPCRKDDFQSRSFRIRTLTEHRITGSG